MLELSPETEDLARRLAEAKHQSVEEAIRDALRSREWMIGKISQKDMSFEAVAARREAVRRIVAEVASLPVLDPRPIQEIVDEINEI